MSGNSSEINLRGEKMQYELQGGERRRKGLRSKFPSFVTSGDFSPKSSNKAQGVEALESTYRHEKHFRRKAFLNANHHRLLKKHLRHTKSLRVALKGFKALENPSGGAPVMILK